MAMHSSSCLLAVRVAQVQQPPFMEQPVAPSVQRPSPSAWMPSAATSSATRGRATARHSTRNSPLSPACCSSSVMSLLHHHPHRRPQWLAFMSEARWARFLILGGIALAVVCACKKKKLPTATVTATTHSVEMKSAPDRDDKSIHESGDKI